MVRSNPIDYETSMGQACPGDPRFPIMAASSWESIWMVSHRITEHRPPTTRMEQLVTTDWLEDHLGDPNVRVADMRGYVITRLLEPGVEEADYRGAHSEYLATHIPGAVYIDWTRDIIDPDDPVPVQIAPPGRFAEAMAVRGIGDESHVIAVDHAGGQFATRLWWALNYYGH